MAAPDRKTPRALSVFKFTRGTFFNPSGWIDYEWLREQNRTIWAVLKSLFVVPKPEYQETFDEAKKRLKLSEADIQFAVRNYRYYALFFAVLSFFSFIYSFYLLFRYLSFSGILIGLGVTGILLVQAFKYDFWALQMKSRRLGMSFKEWKEHILGGQGADK